MSQCCVTTWACLPNWWSSLQIPVSHRKNRAHYDPEDDDDAPRNSVKYASICMCIYLYMSITKRCRARGFGRETMQGERESLLFPTISEKHNKSCCCSEPHRCETLSQFARHPLLHTTDSSLSLFLSSCSFTPPPSQSLL